MAQLFYFPSYQALSGSGTPLAGAKLSFFLTGTTTAASVYADAARTTTLSSPVVADAQGRFPQIYPNPDIVYRARLSDSSNVQQWQEDGLSQQLFPRTDTEIAASVTPVNYAHPPGVVDRYGTNATPGTTDMGPAFQAAINVALATVGSGKGGVAIRFRAGAYSIATAPTFGGATGNILPLDIGGQGVGTQLINNLPASTSYLFPMSGRCGWYLHDFLMLGNSAHKNGGIEVNTVGGPMSIEWKVENVVSMMVGVGLKIADSNNGTVINYKHWPGNNPDLIVPQTFNFADISHGVWMTGNFVHAITLIDPVLPISSGYGSGAARGLKVDCTFSFGVSILGSPLAQTLSGLNNEISWEIAPSNNAANWTIQGVYNEGATIILKNVINSVIGPITNGGVGGALVVNLVSRSNVFLNVQSGVIDLTDATGFSTGNTFIGCITNSPVAWVGGPPPIVPTAYVPDNFVEKGGVFYRCILANTNQAPPNATYWTACKSFNDANEGNNLSTQPNQLINCGFSGVGASAGTTKWRALLPYTTPNLTRSNALGPNHNVVRVGNNSAFTVQAPLNPRNGIEQEFTIRNESGGAMGAIAWFAGTGGWVNPANGFNRTICFYYDSDFIGWRQKWVQTSDVPN